MSDDDGNDAPSADAKWIYHGALLGFSGISFASIVPKIMKAAVITRYGSPDDIKILDAPKPAPGAVEVLNRLHATTASRTDCRQLRPSITEWPLLGHRRSRR